MKKPADLRICAMSGCMFVFKASEHGGKYDCPKCEFCSYGARWAFGPVAYRWYKTQEKYIDAKCWELRQKLEFELRV